MATTAVRPRVLPPGMLPVGGFYRLTVDEYHEMIRNDILTTDDRVELLDGYLVNKMPQNDPHASTVQRLTVDLVRAAPPGWQPRIQLPITLATSEPEPDGAIVRGDRRTFDNRKPGGADFGVVVEVADSSLAFDRGAKAVVYAAAGIPVYWVVNVADGQVEVYTDPDTSVSPPAYRTRTDYLPGQDVPLILDGVQVAAIPAADLLP